MTAIPPGSAPSAPTPAQKSSGCWKWGLVGCLAALVIAVAGVAAIVAFVFGIMKSTDVYRGARLTAERDPRVIQALGAPVHAGFWIIGNVNVEGGSGEADIKFPLIGSKQRGMVHAVGTKSGGGWHYSQLTVEPREGPPIDLLTP